MKNMLSQFKNAQFLMLILIYQQLKTSYQISSQTEKKNHKSIKSVITADLKRQVWKSFKNLFVNTISFFKEVI